MPKLPKINEIARTVGAKGGKQKQVFDEIRKLGLTVRRTEDGEFRVAFKGKMTEDSAYYTDDLQDALDTAKRMLKDRPMN